MTSMVDSLHTYEHYWYSREIGINLDFPNHRGVCHSNLVLQDYRHQRIHWELRPILAPEPVLLIYTLKPSLEVAVGKRYSMVIWNWDSCTCFPCFMTRFREGGSLISGLACTKSHQSMNGREQASLNITAHMFSDPFFFTMSMCRNVCEF